MKSCRARESVRELLILENLADGRDRVPIACRGGHAEALLDDFIGINEGPPEAATKTQDEFPRNADDFDLPLVAGGFGERE